MPHHLIIENKMPQNVVVERLMHLNNIPKDGRQFISNYNIGLIYYLFT